MMGRTHFTLGLAAGAGLGVSMGMDSPHVLGMAIVGGMGALLADIDAPQSTISRNVRPARLLVFWVKHRGMTHSLLLAGLVAGLAYRYLAVWGLSLAVGHVSHLAADMMTREGIPLLWPYGRRLHLLPPGLRLRTGGLVESLVWVVSVGLLGWLAVQIAL